MRAVILDDYQGAALKVADWSALPGVTAEAIGEHIADPDALAERLQGAAVVVAMRERTRFPRALLERLPALRLLVTAGMRNQAIDLDTATALGIQVCGTETLGYPTAELTWGLILGLTRGIPREERAMREARWQVGLGETVRGKTLGVIGLGKLGAQVATIGRAFQMEVLAWSQNLTADRAAEHGAARVEKDELLARADIVTIHLVLGERTRGLIGARELGLMKKSAYLVNTSRGPIVDETALVAALEQGRIAGAALDVYDVEPLPPDHVLRRLDNVLVTPHIGYVTAENYRLIYSQAVEDIGAFLAGTPIRPLNTPAKRP